MNLTRHHKCNPNRTATVLGLTILAIAGVFFTSPARAADMVVHRNLPYTDNKTDERRMLDLYLPSGESEARPLIVWMHGGAWAFGDKRGVQVKPKAFTDQGYAFASINYRFVPKVTMAELGTDVATAIAWLHRNAKTHGIDPSNTFVSGHSAGAHLAALVCTDDQYLKSQKVSMKSIVGCFPVDTAVYNAPLQIKQARAIGVKMYTRAFTTDPAKQKYFSPITHIAKGKHIPPFLVLHVASRADSTGQSKAFAKALNDAGIKATTFGGENKTHGTINKDLGKSNDPPTKAVFEFIEQVLKAK